MRHAAASSLCSASEQFGVIYCHTCETDGRKKYVGQTRLSMEHRWNQHIKAAETPTSYFHRALAAFGPDAFTHEVLETVPVEELNRREAYWIAKLRTSDERYGYNSNDGPVLTIDDSISNAIADLSSSMDVVRTDPKRAIQQFWESLLTTSDCEHVASLIIRGISGEAYNRPIREDERRRLAAAAVTILAVLNESSKATGQEKAA